MDSVEINQVVDEALTEAVQIEDGLIEDGLIEEVSIDGMCGVY